MSRLGPLPIARLARTAFLGLMMLGTAFIAHASLPYFFGEDLHEFLIEKLPLPHEGVWLVALHVHVVAALFSLPACLVLLSRRVLRRMPRVHRSLGRLTGLLVLGALVPSGAWLAVYAKGGLLSTLGFWLSGGIVAVAMVQGIVDARAGRVAAHRRSALHVFAQLSVAVTSRLMLVALDVAGLDPDVAYLVALWVPVVASAVVVEWIAGSSGVRRNHASRGRSLVVRPAV